MAAPHLPTARLSRRQVAKGAGALVLGFSLLPRAGFAQTATTTPPAPKLPGDLPAAPRLDAWLRINAEGSVTVYTGKVELGQGAKTALAQIAAEELDVALGRIDIITADTALTPDEGYTAGSQTIEYSGTAIRLVGAEARQILLELAAAKLGVPVERLTVDDGVVTTADKPAATSYWDLVRPDLLARAATGTVKPKPPARHSVVGTAVERLDIPGKVMGGVAYVHDLRLPGMLFGRVVRPPSRGAVLTALDEGPARALPGIVAIVRDGSFVGVVAKREEHAIQARERLIKGAAWREQDSLPDANALEAVITGLPGTPHVIRDQGTKPATVAKTLEARYTRPFIAHASIGPSCAIAQFKDGAYMVWSHSQGIFPLRRDLAKVLAVGEDKLHVIHMEGAGCYGHNGADDAALDAALLARAVGGQPVKLQWMRDDEFKWEPYGTAMVAHATASLDDKGVIADWSYEVWSPTHSTRPGQKGGSGLLAGWYLETPVGAPTPVPIPLPAGGGDRNALPLYDFAVQHVVHHFTEAQPLHVSALRTLGAHCNVFSIESFMDELAHAAGADPVQFRLAHLKDPRGRRVLEAAAERAHWQTGETGDGTRGRGVAFAKYKNLSTYVAVIAEVTVDRKSGGVRVLKATAAVDAGQIINPDGLINQIEGGIIQATSWTLKEAIRFDRRRILTESWADYDILRFPEVPVVDVVLLDHPDERALGAGEASTGPMAAAIANALANATGARVRSMPLTPAKVAAALG
jgi:CO/xanthine dehydrogenase Mo-binding subunit